jgi:hypothetical protein
VPLDQLAARLTLQFGHLLGHGGRGEVQRLGGGGERALIRDGRQHPEPDQIKHIVMLTHRTHEY